MCSFDSLLYLVCHAVKVRLQCLKVTDMITCVQLICICVITANNTFTEFIKNEFKE